MRTKILISTLLIALTLTAGLSWQYRNGTVAEVEAGLPPELKPKLRVLKELAGLLEDLQQPMGTFSRVTGWIRIQNQAKQLLSFCKRARPPFQRR